MMLALSVLPLHHTFEFSAGFLMPLMHGASITYLEEIDADNLQALFRARHGYGGPRKNFGLAAPHTDGNAQQATKALLIEMIDNIERFEPRLRDVTLRSAGRSRIGATTLLGLGGDDGLRVSLEAEQPWEGSDLRHPTVLVAPCLRGGAGCPQAGAAFASSGLPPYLLLYQGQDGSLGLASADASRCLSCCTWIFNSVMLSASARVSASQRGARFASDAKTRKPNAVPAASATP